MSKRVSLTDAKVQGESALHFPLVDGIEPGSIATTVTHEKAVVSIDLDGEGDVLGITIQW